MRNFLLGILVGVSLMGLVWQEVNFRTEVYMRLGRIEGYLGQLDKMIRGASNETDTMPYPASKGLRASR